MNKSDLLAFDAPRIREAAGAALILPPISITEDCAPLSEGGRNDFYSNADYWWPDPDKHDGIPFIRRDGQTNPGNFNRHRLALRRVRDAVAALGAGFQLNGDDRGPAKAAVLLETFFLDPRTRMNPHLEYAQAIPGVTPGRGIGIIDTLHLIEVPVAVDAMKDSAGFPEETLDGLRKWFGDYLDWMMTSRNGRAEAAEKNNHAVAFWLQVAVFARFVADSWRLDECRRQFKEVLLPDQMAVDGSFPAELARTKPYAYSIFQLDNLATLGHVLSTQDENFLDFSLPDGRGLRKAVGYLCPFLADKFQWPLPPDIQAWEGWPCRQPSLLFAGLAYDEPSYLELWRRLPPDPVDEEMRRNMALTQPALWLAQPG